MVLSDHKLIDLVALDESNNAIILSMVEARSWGDKGVLLVDLQEKLNTYLVFVTDGQLVKDYPRAKNRKIVFRLFCKELPGAEEKKFIEIVRRNYLMPKNIEWVESIIEA